MMNGTRPARLFALLLICLVAGCQTNAGSALTEEPLSPDEQVIKNLEPYDPIYKVNYAGRVVALKLEGRRVPATALAEVQHLTELTELSLYAASLTDDSLKQLQSLAALQGLGLGEATISEKGLANLESLSSLKWLWLSRSLATTPEAEKLKNAIPGLTIFPQ